MMTDLRHQLRLITHEALCNIRATPLSSLLRILIAAIAAAGCILYTVHDVNGIQGRYQAQLDAGRYMWREAGATQTARISASRCDALQAVDGVTAAGSVLDTASASLSNQPLATYDIRRVTPGYVAAIWPDADPGALDGGVVVGNLAATNLGLVPGAAVTFLRPSKTWIPTSSSVAMVMGSSPRFSTADRQILVVAPPTGTTTECVVAAAPGASNSVGTLMSSWFPPDTGSLTSPWLRDQQFGVSPEDELLSRRSQFGWPVGLLLIILTTGYLWYGRRSDDALYLLLGWRKRSLFVLHLIETICLSIVPAAVSGIVALSAVTKDASVTSLRLAPLDLVSLQIGILFVPVVFLVWTRRKGLLDALKGF